MPPKRSRRKQSTQKPPLVFTESPVHVIHRLPSPVLPCDHPAHADVVPVELGTSLWVSPQFRGRGSARKSRRRNNRTQRLGEATVSGCEHDESNDTEARNIKNYVPLNMLGEEEEEESVITTVDELSDTDAAKRHTRSEPPTPITEECQIPRVTRILRGLNNSHTENTGKSPSEFTQVRPKADRGKKRSKLKFPDQNSNGDSTPVKEASGDTFINDKDLKEQDSFCAEGFDSVATPDGDCASSIPCLGSMDNLKQGSGRYKKDRGVLSHVLETTLLSSPLSSAKLPKVLAFDTPESEYGKKLRWRQLHKRTGKTQKKRLSSLSPIT